MAKILPEQLARHKSYALTIATIVPRPIAWITTVGEENGVNLAPFSFFNAITNDPMTLMVSIGRRRGKRKDTANNLLEKRMGVVHIPTADQLKSVVLSSADFDADVDEIREAGLTPAPTITINGCRLKELPVAMECVVVGHQEVGNEPNDVFFLEVHLLHCDDSLLDEKQVPKTEAFNALGRLGHGDYVSTHGAAYTLPRPRTPEAVHDGSWPPPPRK